MKTEEQMIDMLVLLGDLLGRCDPQFSLVCRVIMWVRD